MARARGTRACSSCSRTPSWRWRSSSTTSGRSPTGWISEHLIDQASLSWPSHPHPVGCGCADTTADAASGRERLMAMAIAERTEGVPPTGPVRIQRAALIVNARARRAAASFTRARALLTAAGVPIVAAEALHDAARLRATVRAALDDGCDLIILGGGDGSISAVVDDLAHHHAALGLLPLGTANDLARTLAIPSDLDAACATIARGTVAAVDLGLVGDTYFVNVVSVGLGAAVIPAMSPTLKRLAGPLAYPVAAAPALLGH